MESLGINGPLFPFFPILCIPKERLVGEIPNQAIARTGSMTEVPRCQFGLAPPSHCRLTHCFKCAPECTPYPEPPASEWIRSPSESNRLNPSPLPLSLVQWRDTKQLIRVPPRAFFQ